MKSLKTIIGRTDHVDLPELGILNAAAKIDTGAYTSSIHCHQISLDGDMLSFSLAAEEPGRESSCFSTRDFSQKRIKSSNGRSEMRYIIKTKILLFGKLYTAEFSLSDRSAMKNPILLGRKLLKGKFLVDVSKKDLSFNSKNK